MTVTIKDVANKCNVSIATVSRVINNSELVTKDTREKVHAAIKELGYLPNIIARGLSTKKTNTIGVIIPDISNPFFGEMISGVEEQADKEDYDIIICNSGYNSEKIFKDILNLKSRGVEGIIMSPADVDESTLDYLRENNFPFALTGPISYKYPINYVSVDNIAGSQKAVEHLIKLGHKKIAYVSNKRRNYFNQLRYEGYKNTIISNGLKLDENLYLTDDAHDEIKKIKSLNMKDRPTAIFAFNDYTALAYMEALERNGIKVPNDMAIVGFDNIKMASYYSIELTTINNRQTEFGKLVVKMLLENINGDRSKTQQLIKEPKLIIRKTCGSK